MTFAFPTKCLNDIATKIDYGVTASATENDTGTKFLRITDIQDGTVDWGGVPYCEAPENKLLLAKLEDGDIVFARTGATTGKSFLVKSPPAGAVFASYLIRVKPSRWVHADYLAHFFQSSTYWNQIQLKTQGAAQGGVNATSLSELRVPLPPLDEQRRIAAILDKADALRRKRKRVLDLIDGLTQSIFMEMFGDPIENRRKYPTRRLIDLVDPTRGISYGIVQRGDDQDVGVKVLRISDFQSGKVVDSGLKMTTPEIAGQYRRTVLKGRELVISIRGTVGRCAEVPWELSGANVSREVAVIPTIEKDLNDFYLALLRTASAQQRLGQDVKGVAQSGINLEDLRELLIIQPSKAEIENFQRTRHKMCTLDRDVCLHVTQFELLFSSLQQRAFSGQL